MATSDIAIVGMECVLPGAADLAQYWDNLVEGLDAIGEVPPGRLNGRDRLSAEHAGPIGCARGGFLPEKLRFDPLRYGVMPTIVPHGDPDQFLMLHVIDAAMADAAVAADHPVRQRTDVIIGRGGYITNKMSEIYYRSDLLGHLLDWLARRFPGLSEAELQALAKELQQNVPGNDVDNITTVIPNLVASRTANRLNLRGAAYTVDAACASSLVAVEHAVQRLRLGRCDLAVASGIFLCQTPTFWTIFTQLGAMSPTQQIRPFDRRADGLLVGEGAGAVVLKRLEDAQRDGDRVYALIKGVGMASDGRDTHILSSSSKGQVDALRRAYTDAQLDPATIGYLEAHGTATVAGDLAELQTIKSFFGSRDKLPPFRAMGSVKSMIGHTMPAAGIASIIKTALCLSNKCLVPSLHCDDPHPELERSPFYVNRETRPWIHDPVAHSRRAGVNAFGFGGINVHVVMEEVPTGAAEPARRLRARPHNPGRHRDSEVLLFSAASGADLAGQLQRLDGYLAKHDDASLADVAFTLAEEADFSRPHKLALVATDVAHARRLIASCLQYLESDTTALQAVEGIYYSPSAAEPIGKVAGIFPGIGFPGLIGNYPAHLLELCRYFPEVREEFDKVEWRDRHADDTIPTSLIFSPPSIFPDSLQQSLRNRIAAMKVIEGANGDEIHLEPCERNIAASCVTLANWVSWILLRQLQVPVHMVCGQSQGEIAAICATEMLNVGEVIPRFWQALAVSPAYAGKGRLAFVAAPESRIASYLAESPDTAIAIHIAPEMLILGGMDAHIADVCRRLRDEGVIAKELPYPPIHTPRLSHMREELLRIIDMNFRFRKPSFPIYSAITESTFPDGEDEIRELILSNLDRPVRFWQTIHRMYADGARLFLQIGGGSLAANIKTILPKPDIVGAAVDVEHYPAVTQLNHMVATLFAAGFKFDPSYLYRHRQPRKLHLEAPQGKAEPQRMLLPLRMDWIPLPEVVPQPIEQPAQATEAVAAPTEPIPGIAEMPAVVEAAEAETEYEPGDGPILPLLGDVVHLVPDQEVVTERLLDLDEDLFLHDHVLISEESGKAVEHRGPILPMTFILECAAETASCLAPGLGLIGFEKITAFRWIDFRDTRSLRLEVKGRVEATDPATGVRRIAVEIASDGRPNAALTVLFCHSYREDVRLNFSDFTNARAWPLAAPDIYTERHMFHGPRFRCVSSLDVLADQGLVGEITVQPKDDLFASVPDPHLMVDPVVLDGVAQLVAMYAIANGVFLMPAKISKLELYGPTPPPGTRVPVRIEVRNMSTAGRTVTADAEIQDGRGGVWFRFEGINEWLYDYAPQLQDTQRLPSRYHLATELPLPGGRDDAVGVLLPRGDFRHASIDWLGRLFLHQDEWEYLEGLKILPKQWQWLMGRVAAKDAIRLNLAARMGTEMLHPALILLEAEEGGRPYPVPLEGFPPMPEISIAHTDGWAAAVAGNAYCGIDIEPTNRDVSDILSVFATPEEIELLASLGDARDGQFWPLRLWCAKEALGKALGTGLAGRPLDFQATDLESDGGLLLYHRPTEATYPVHTGQYGELIVAYATLAEAGPQAVALSEATSGLTSGFEETFS